MLVPTSDEAHNNQTAVDGEDAEGSVDEEAQQEAVRAQQLAAEEEAAGIDPDSELAHELEVLTNRATRSGRISKARRRFGIEGY